MSILSKAMSAFQSNEYINVYLEESIPAAIYKVFGLPQDSEHFRVSFNRMQESISNIRQSENCRYVIADFQDALTPIPDDIEWIYKTHLPSIYQAGITHLAIILPRSVFTLFAIQEILLNIDQPLIINSFKSYHEAAEWLKGLNR